jgi:hypothetical protein
VRQEEQQPLVHVLAEQAGAFLGARGAEGEHLAAERTEVLRLAVGVRALDPRNALGVVPAVEEAFHRFRDVFPAVFAQPCGELTIVSSEDLGKMGAEEPLQRACAPRAVRAWGCRIHGQRELVCHA